jgi:anti-sigma factor RsiW
MSCLGPRLADLADGRLDPVSADRALVHVAGCPACQRELAEQRRIHRLLAVAPAPGPSESFLARLAQTPVQAGPTGPAGGRTPGGRPPGPRGSRGPARRRARLRTAVVAAGGAAAVAAAFALGGNAIAMFTPASPPGLSPVVPAVDTYTAEHAASTDRLPLTAPGASIVLVSYGASSPAPPSAADRAAVRLRSS